MQTDTRAKLSLFHPTKADPQPMLEYAKSQSTSSTPLQPQLNNKLQIFWNEKYLLRTCFLLRLQDRTSDAEWLESFVQREYPKVWQRRDQWFYFAARDPKLQRQMKGKVDAPWIPKSFPYRPRKSQPFPKRLRESEYSFTPSH